MNDRRFDQPYPNNAGGMQQPPLDRVPREQTRYPVPPPRNNAGADGMGAPPRRDRRRTRAQGDNLVASGTVPARPDGHQGSLASTTGQICTYDTGPDEDGEESDTLVLFAKAYDFSEMAVTGLPTGAANPFDGVASSVLPTNVKQSLIVLAELQWGHDGATKKVTTNLCAGQIVRAGLAGSYVHMRAKLSAKYLKRMQGANLGGTLNFFYIDGDPDVRNNVWNSMFSPALDPNLGYDPGTVPTTPIHVDGIVGKGAATISQGGSFDRSARATRRFFGTFPIVATAYPGGGAFVFCPVAYGASAVMLQANSTLFINPGGAAASPLLFGMIDAAGNVVAQQAANTFLPLIDNCVQVFAYNPAANAVENPFAFIYDLGL